MGARRRLVFWVPVLGLLPLALAVVAGSLAQGGRPPAAKVANAPAAAEPPPSPTPAARVAAPTPTAVEQALARASPAPTAEPAVPAATPGPAEPTAEPAALPYSAYRVQPGDTVRLIAEKFGVSTASVVRANGLSNPDRLRVGQLLTIPRESGTLYRVQPGETLDQIAARTGVAAERIQEASRLPTASVEPGEVVLIPEAARAPAK